MIPRLLIAVILLSCLGTAAPRFPLKWPPPPGYRTETIPFPLDFAPQIKWQGLEELRFAPGFKDPGADDYFTYAFIWLLDKDTYIDAAAIERALERALTWYFHGLMDAVGKSRKRTTSYPTSVRVRHQPNNPNWPHIPRYVVTASTWDAFFTGQQLSLTLNVYEPDSPIEQYRLFYIEVSPNLSTPSVQQGLRTLRQALVL